MAESAENSIRSIGNRWRILVWGAAVVLLLLPLVAMQFTDEVVWGPGDFAVFAVMLVGACAAFELVTMKPRNTAYKLAFGLALATGFILIWMNLAVGLIGEEDNPANLMYVGVLAVGTIGAFLARFEPNGMSRALFATALAHALVAVIALIAGMLPEIGLVFLNGFFVALFAGSALLFQRAAKGEKTT